MTLPPAEPRSATPSVAMQALPVTLPPSGVDVGVAPGAAVMSVR